MFRYAFVLVVLCQITPVLGQWNEWFYSISFEDTAFLNRISIDTASNPNNVWQIGRPEFDSAISKPNVIATDTLKTYGINDTSSFTFKHIAQWGFGMPHTVEISGYYNVNSDSLRDYGLMEFSPDNGMTWINLMYDTIYNSHLYWYNKKPVLTGNSFGWKEFSINLASLGNHLGIQEGDTVLYRFTFISDSIQDTLNGLMFDQFSFQDYVEGIEEIYNHSFTSKVFPNPGDQSIRIDFEDHTNTAFNLKVVDQLGRVVLTQTMTARENELQTSSLKTGAYSYLLENKQLSSVSRGKFIISRE